MTYHTPNLVEDLRARAGTNAPSFLRLLNEWKSDVQKIVSDLPLKFPKRDHGFAKSPRKRWSPTEVEFLRQNYMRLGVKRTADQLKRTDHAVLVKARHLGLFRRRPMP